MQHSAELRRCLLDVDVAGIRKLWRHVAPHLPQPETDYEACAAIHMARTQATFLTVDARCYSHAWLRDENLPSQLPDWLKPKAERMYPVGFSAVGISVSTANGRENDFTRAVCGVVVS